MLIICSSGLSHRKEENGNLIMLAGGDSLSRRDVRCEMEAHDHACKKLFLSETTNRTIRTVSFILATKDGEHLFAKPGSKEFSKSGG